MIRLKREAKDELKEYFSRCIQFFEDVDYTENDIYDFSEEMKKVANEIQHGIQSFKCYKD